MCALPDDYDGLVGVARVAAQPEISPLPFELIEGNEHHGPYIVNTYGGTVCDFYTMSNPSALSVRNGGDSRPVPFTCADGNAAFMVRAANCHDELVAALKRWRALGGGTHALRVDTDTILARAEAAS